MAKKLTSEKAKQMLRDDSAQGHKLTAKQKRYFGYIAGGSTPKANNGWLEKYANGGDNYGTEENYNDSKGEIFPIGGTYTTKGFNYNSAWGGRWKNGGEAPTIQKEFAMGKEIEKEHKPTLDYIKEYHNKFGEFPSLQSVAESITTDHIKDFTKIEDPKSTSYYKGLVEGHLSDEVSKYVQGGDIPPRQGAPSEGKYGKKTIPSAQDGKKTPTDSSAAFLQDWYKNRVIPNPENQKAFLKDQKQFIENTQRFPPLRKVYMIDNTPSIAAQYDPSTNIMRVKSDYMTDPYIKTHERTHFIDLTGTIGEELRDIHRNVVKQSLKSPEQLSKRYSNDYEYYSDADEIHARIMALRQKAGFKPTQTVSPEDLNRFLDSYEGGETNIDDILRLSKDRKAILNMLNNMARATEEDKSDNISAEDGKTIYYKNGLDFKPKMMETGGSIQDKGQLEKLDNLTNFTNYNKKWLNKYV